MSNEPPATDKLVTVPTDEAEPIDGEVEAILEKMPPHLIRDTLVAIIREGTGPKYDAETLRIAAATADKDNDNRLTYLMRKLEVQDGQHKREHELEEKKYRSSTKLLWPLLLTAILLVLGCITAGIYLAAIGKETLGFSILSATVAAMFSYLGGLGTPRFWKSTK